MRENQVKLRTKVDGENHVVSIKFEVYPGRCIVRMVSENSTFTQPCAFKFFLQSAFMYACYFSTSSYMWRKFLKPRTEYKSLIKHVICDGKLTSFLLDLFTQRVVCDTAKVCDVIIPTARSEDLLLIQSAFCGIRTNVEQFQKLVLFASNVPKHSFIKLAYYFE